jgi:two-component system NtrC family sensor kinase
MRILLVEDNIDHQFLIGKKLKEHYSNLSIDVVITAGEAKDLVEKNSYDTILLDYRLKGSSGIELFQWMRTTEIDVPVIMITNLEDVGLAVQAIKLGVYDYLCKSKESLDRLPFLIDKATEESRLKRRLKEAEFKYRTLVEGIDEAVFLLTGDGEILYISSTVEKLFGCSEKECREQFRQLFSSEGWRIFQRESKSVFKGKRIEPFVVEMRRMDGHTLMAEINESQFGEHGIIGTIQDVTKRVRLEQTVQNEREETRIANKKLKGAIEELERTQEQLIQSAKLAAIGQLVSGVAHELNNPLFSALGNTELLIMDGADGDDKRAKLEEILESINRARVIIKDLLRFSQAESLDKEVVSIHEIIKRAMQLREYELRVHNVAVDYHLESTNNYIYGNFAQLQRALLNIVINAEQAIREGSEGGLIKINSSYDKKRRKIAIEISNNGPSIPADVVSNIFDPFFSTKDVGKGTGLGLSTAYGIIKDHGGELHVKSDKNWTTFQITLPSRAQASQKQLALPEKRAMNGEVGRGGGETILLFHGERVVRNLLKDFLKRKGFTVLSVSTEKNALEKLQNHDIDIIIVDIETPAINVEPFFKKLKNKKPELAGKLLFITEDMCDDGTEKMIGDLGIPQLIKPFSFDEMMHQINKIK